MKRLVRKAEYEMSFNDIKDAISSGFEVFDGVVENDKILNVMQNFESYIGEASNKVGLSLNCVWQYNDNINIMAYYIDGGNSVYLNEAAIDKISKTSDEVLRWIAYHEVGHAFDDKNNHASASEEWENLMIQDTTGLADWGGDLYDAKDKPAEAFANAFFAIHGGDGYGLESEAIESFIKGLN